MKVVITVIEAEENKNKLPKEVKEQIWETILHHAKCDRGDVLNFAEELKKAFILIKFLKFFLRCRYQKSSSFS
ncbi:hypothetical protein CDE51_09925 [Pasteurella multocida]|nr:hypothetical protein CDE51_09925 [Pasteurella multocida]